MEKLLLGEGDAGAAVVLLGELILGVGAQVVIDQGFHVSQRVLHSKQSRAGILQKEREKKESLLLTSFHLRHRTDIS